MYSMCKPAITIGPKHGNLRGPVARGPNHPCFPAVVFHGLSDNDMEDEDGEVECLSTYPEETHTPELYNPKATGKMKVASMKYEDRDNSPDVTGPESGSKSDVRFDLSPISYYLTRSPRRISGVP